MSSTIPGARKAKRVGGPWGSHHNQPQLRPEEGGLQVPLKEG